MRFFVSASASFLFLLASVIWTPATSSATPSVGTSPSFANPTFESPIFYASPSPPASAHNLPGPTASLDVVLVTNSFPKETSLGYRNVCNGQETTILDIHNDLAAKTQYNLPPVVLSVGIYEFFIMDAKGDGKRTAI
jgi:hypothetical protein